jgi:hypothetical protein
MSGSVFEAPQRVAKRIERWMFTPLPLGRVAALRVIIYLFAWYDVFSYSPPDVERVSVPSSYRPLAVERVLHMPTPTHALAVAVEIALPICATLAAFGRLPRLLGWLTAALYFDWLVMGDSYGYVPHDRLAFVIALAVLPSVGSARCGDLSVSDRAGWALRCIQLGVIGTYWFSAWAKIRYGGWHWPNGAVLTWALLRRPTPLGTYLLHHPLFVHLSQWGAICAEAMSPVVLFLRGRGVYVAVGIMFTFHLYSQLTLKISFLPHVLCVLAFLPLERLGVLVLRVRQWRPWLPAAPVMPAD